MVATANEWLERNDHLDVVNCETIRVLYKFNDCGNYYELRPNDVSHYVYGSEKNNILRVLRVWVRKRVDLSGDLEDSPGTNSSNTTFTTIVDLTLSESNVTPALPAPSSTVGDGGYSSVASKSPTHRPLTATESNGSTASEPSSFAGPVGREMRSNSIESQTHEPSAIAHGNLTAAKQQHHFRLQQQNSQQQFQFPQQTGSATQPSPVGAANSNTFENAAAVAAHATTNASSMPSSNMTRLNRQQSLHRQLSFQQQLSPQPNRAKSTVTKAQAKFDLLDYFDIVPECTESKAKDSPSVAPSNSKADKFERLDECVRRLNHMLSSGRVRGQLLCVETIASEASIDWKVQPERSFTEFSSKTVLFLRCYFRPDLATETTEQVGTFIN
jgi:hypothetical protein